MRIQLMIDSTTDLPKEVIEQYNMKVVPLSVLFGEEEFFDLSPTEFYEKLADAEEMPTTSQVPPERFMTAFEESLKEYDHIILVTIGSNASGTYQSACLAREEVSADKITLLDSNMLCLGTGYLALIVAKMIEAGESIEAIEEAAKDITDNNIQHIFCVDTLEYLKKGGRITGTKAFVAEMLNIKPILSVEDAITKPFAKVRGRKKVISYYIDYIKKTLDHEKSAYILLGHAMDPTSAKKLEKGIREEVGYKGEIIIGEIGEIIGTHAGPGVLAAFYYKK